MNRRELTRQNFVALFRYNTPEEIEMAEGKGKKVFGKLFSEYSGEIEKINNSRYLSNSILQHSTEMQKLDLSLKISI